MKEIRFKDLDWYVLEEKDGITKLLLKNVLNKERIKKYADDDFMYNDEYVRHQDTIRPYDWDKSYIKNIILPNFLNDLGVDAEIDLLSIDEVRDLPDEIKECDLSYWTKSRSDNSNYAFDVYNDGGVDDDIVRYYNAVRPVLYLKSVNLFGEEARRKSCTQKINIEKINLDYSISNEICDEVVRKTLCDIIENQRTHEDKINEIIDILREINQ